MTLLFAQSHSYSCSLFRVLFLFFNDTATTEIYTLSLHDALPIYRSRAIRHAHGRRVLRVGVEVQERSEEHTSELQSHLNLVCRLLLEINNDFGDNNYDAEQKEDRKSTRQTSKSH